ncbi:hypothetical protein MCS25_04555 [Porphyromonas gingivalis]|nr:hypothetical protein [Porphyromonas gingivalis]USI98668.1 hypothetical protein MCS25_04555 [Porphyromonas gingivalis]
MGKVAVQISPKEGIFRSCNRGFSQVKTMELPESWLKKRMKDRELTAENQTVRTLSEKREQNGCKPVEIVSRLTQSPSMEVASLVSIISASIGYLVSMEEQNERGWEQIVRG